MCIRDRREDLSPEEEFYSFIERFPDIHAQLRDAKPIRAWMRTGRLQYSTQHVVGDRFALLAHAADFIDPLYSKGLYVTHMTIMKVADLILHARRTGDYSAAAFASLEEMTLGYIDMHDRLVANSYKSWGNYKLWAVYEAVSYTHLDVYKRQILSSTRVSTTASSLPRRLQSKLGNSHRISSTWTVSGAMT